MEQLSQEKRDEIAKALEARGATLPCPRCGNLKFTIVDGYFSQPLQSQLGGIVLGGPTVPSAIIACERCGYLMQHALGSLGLLPGDEVEKDKVKE